MNFIRRIISEPLVHFLAIGAAIFILYGVVTPETRNTENALIVSVAMQDNIKARFESTRQRPPTEPEMEALIQNHLREEVLYRRAVALGLDTNDTVVRGRMRQKMEFFADSAARLLEPTDAELQELLEISPDLYSKPGQIEFRQIYLGEQPTIAEVKDIVTQLEEIAMSEKFADLGVRTLLPREMEMTGLRNVEGVFGPDFSTAIESLETEVWVGPVTSAYGLHMVMVTAKTEPKLHSVTDIRDVLEREWRFAKSVEIKDQQFDELLAKYEVTIESGDTK